MIKRVLAVGLVVTLTSCTTTWKKWDPDAKRYTAVTKAYDKFQDQTTVRLYNSVVSHSWGWCNMIGAFTSPGQSVRRPSKVLFGFSGRGDFWPYGQIDSLIILADGQRFKLPLTSDLSWVPAAMPEETLVGFLPADDLVAISKAKAVEVQLGKFTLDLEGEPMVALRDLAEAIDQAN